MPAYFVGQHCPEFEQLEGIIETLLLRDAPFSDESAACLGQVMTHGWAEYDDREGRILSVGRYPDVFNQTVTDVSFAQALDLNGISTLLASAEIVRFLRFEGGTVTKYDQGLRLLNRINREHFSLDEASGVPQPLRSSSEIPGFVVWDMRQMMNQVDATMLVPGSSL